MKPIILTETREITKVLETTLSEADVKNIIEKLKIAKVNEDTLITAEYFYQCALGNESDCLSYEYFDKGGYWHSTDYYDGTEYSGYAKAGYHRKNDRLIEIVTYAREQGLLSIKETICSDNFKHHDLYVRNRQVKYY
jgi:hypothetical protein